MFAAVLLTAAAVGQVQVHVPTGCVQQVYLKYDGHVIKIERREVMVGGVPGTGTWGEWVQAFCEPPGAREYRYMADEWPKRVNQGAVRDALGEEWWSHFAKMREARTSEWWNLSGVPGYRGVGPGWVLEKTKPAEPERRAAVAWSTWDG